MANHPTPPSNMTHYALTESQTLVMEEGKEALVEALRTTISESVKTRIQEAIDAGIIVPPDRVDNTLPVPEEQPLEGKPHEPPLGESTQTQRQNEKKEDNKREERHDDKRGR